MIASNSELSRRLDEMEKEYVNKFKLVFEGHPGPHGSAEPKNERSASRLVRKCSRPRRVLVIIHLCQTSD